VFALGVHCGARTAYGGLLERPLGRVVTLYKSKLIANKL
jgi:hypothetical protein